MSFRVVVYHCAAWGGCLALAGLLIGAGPGAVDFFAALLRTKDSRGGRRKMLHGMAGGTLGALFGGLAFAGIRTAWEKAGIDPFDDDRWTPGSTQLTAFGA